MPHILSEMDEDITRLEGANSNPEIETKLGTLRTLVHDVDAVIGEESETVAHNALHDTGKWLKKAEVTDNDFETKLDEFIALLDQYD